MTTVASTMFTWSGKTFVVTSADGRSGTVSASIDAAYAAAAGTGTCSVEVAAATITKP